MSEPAVPQLTNNKSRGGEEAYDEELEKVSQECKEMLLSLPREKGWDTPYLYLYQDFWSQPLRIQAISSFQKHFQAKDSDIFVISSPKSGTTWLKALTFSIANRERCPPSQNDHPLLTSNPHDLVPLFEFKLYGNNQVPDLSNLPEPRLFGTHIPFSSLPDSIKKSNCKIIYLCRNPFDSFISYWFFMGKVKSASPLTLEEAFDKYCKGISGFGPFWTHMLSYWNASRENCNKILFLKYEDLKGDTNFHVKRMAEFLDCPFALKEESSGVIENIIDLCSFQKLKELEVNKNGIYMQRWEHKNFFRKGEIGDWVNYFSPSMVEKLSKVTEEKFGGSGLSFKLLP